MSVFLKEAFRGLTPYVPGEQPRNGEFIKLNTNESPFPPPSSVLDCISPAEIERLRLYSDPESLSLTRAIAEYNGVNEQNVLATNGSDEALAFIFCGFFDSKRGVCFPDITYGFYPVFCGFAGLKYREIPLKDDFTVDVDAFVSAPESVVIANPNAPTGIALTVSEIRRILDASPDRLVVVDEAYVDFGTYSCVPLIKEYGNLIVVQTFSKSRSLAGARLGTVFACPELIRDLKTVKYSFNPYNVNGLTARIGEASLKDAAYFRYCRAQIMKTRSLCAKELAEAGFEVLSGSANFLFIRHGSTAGKELYEELKKRGILVRRFDRERIRDFIRVTVGTEKQMRAFLSEAVSITGGKK